MNNSRTEVSAKTILEQKNLECRILSVDDSKLNCNLVTELLSQFPGIMVDCVYSGEEALRTLKNDYYDLIFLDLRMPGMGGMDTARKIRQMPGNEAIPIVALTANASSEDKKECVRAGMNDFLSKPYFSETLFRMLLKWLADDDNDPKWSI